MPEQLVLPYTRRERIIHRLLLIAAVLFISSVPIVLAIFSVEYGKMQNRVLELEKEVKECKR